MKKRFLLLALLLFLSLAACGEPPQPPPAGLAGVYQSTRWLLGDCEKTILVLREDGRFWFRSLRIGLKPEKTRGETAWEGRYELKGPVLTLHCGKTDYRLLYLDGTIYWNTLEKRS